MGEWSWKPEDAGLFTLYLGNRPLLSASACAEDQISGQVIDTRTARLVSQIREGDALILRYENEAGLALTETLRIAENAAEASCVLSRADGSPVRTNRLTPLIAHGKGDETPYLWRHLGARMLQIPYDNDMWMRYEAVALRAGRRSFDLTVLFMESTREGLLIGAKDFNTWKNALVCSPTDARILEARCGDGACGEDSHDVNPHGSLEAPEVASSRFAVLYGPDWRVLLEAYGDLLRKEREPRRWSLGVPFGFNTYAGMARTLTPEKFGNSGDFVFSELQPRGFENGGRTSINMDGGWQFLLGVEEALKSRDRLHARGQLAGIYDAPFACFSRDLDAPLPLMEDHSYREILLRNDRGELLPRVDGALPYDVTHPLWEAWMTRIAERFVSWNYDYLKIDFLSHAGMEGHHANPTVRTGRQALHFGYQVLADLYDERRIGRPFFLSLSIAPLFPYGWGNARRFSCDAFGLSEDVEYVLNAQTYSWWTSGRLYQFNDPDHIVLLRSFCMLQDSTEGEARARYTSAVIAGTVMLLSEDYDRPGARDRTLKLAGNAAVNAVAREGIAFRPVDAAGGSASTAYVARIRDENHLALFAWKGHPEDVSLSLSRAGLPDGEYEDLWTGRRIFSSGDTLTWHFDGTDAALLRHIFISETD